MRMITMIDRVDLISKLTSVIFKNLQVEFEKNFQKVRVQLSFRKLIGDQ